MSNPNESLFEWRLLRRKITFWRGATFVILALAIIGSAASLSMQETGKNTPHIAKIRVEGMITENEELIGRIQDAGNDEAVKAIIISVDSSGGTTVGGEAIFEAVRGAAEKKPVVAQVGTLAASAGYIVAAGTDHIVARQTSIIGSIGVIVQFPNFSELLKNMGVDFETIKSAPLKAEPSMFNATTAEERAVLQNMIDDSFAWFVELVTDRRPMTRSEVEAVATGAVFTGRQALTMKLIDATGGEDKAIAWLKTKDVDVKLEVVEWEKPPRRSGFSPFRVMSFIDGGETEAFFANLRENSMMQRLFLDGLLSVWQIEKQ